MKRLCHARYSIYIVLCFHSASLLTCALYVPHPPTHLSQKHHGLLIQLAQQVIAEVKSDAIESGVHVDED